MKKATKKASTSKPSLQQALSLQNQGLSLRAIGAELGCSYQRIRRLLAKTGPRAEPTRFLWDGESLTRRQVEKRLRRIAKEGGHKPPEGVMRKWMADVFQAYYEVQDLDRVALLLTVGPPRPGRPSSYAPSILRDENSWSKRRSPVKVASSFGDEGWNLDTIAVGDYRMFR
jgi:hypothetical protein